MGGMKRERVTVVVPTYNERDNLQRLAPAVLEHGYRLLIVDDDSPDRTGEVADKLAMRHGVRVEVIHRRPPRGLGLAYLDGFAHALEAGAELICQMDADLSHDPAQLPALIDVAGAGRVAVGSRYRPGGRVVNWPLHRLVLSRAANRYVRAITGLPIADCTSGFRCWPRSVLAALPLARHVSHGYVFQVETLYEAARLGVGIDEVPIVFVERRHGRSKVSVRILAEACVVPWRLRSRGRLRPGTRGVAT